jgi:hypothetical protein
MFFFGAALLAAVALASCSGVPASSEGVAKKMLRAYGGPAKVARLQSYVGKGFIRNLSSELVARSYAFDVYRKGKLYKHKIMSAPAGRLSNVIVFYFDGTTNHRWESGKGEETIPTMEAGILRYRFPEVIQWVQGPDCDCEKPSVEKSSDILRLRCTEGDNVVTLSIDRKSWLLRGVEFRNSKDSSVVFTETYDHYSDIDGIPFPEEFKATYGGKLYYDYTLVSIDLTSDLPDSLFRVTPEDSAGIVKGGVREAPAR